MLLPQQKVSSMLPPDKDIIHDISQWRYNPCRRPTKISFMPSPDEITTHADPQWRYHPCRPKINIIHAVARQRYHPYCPPTNVSSMLPQKRYHSCHCLPNVSSMLPPDKGIIYDACQRYHPCRPRTKVSSMMFPAKGIIHAIPQQSYHICCPPNVYIMHTVYYVSVVHWDIDTKSPWLVNTLTVDYLYSIDTKHEYNMHSWSTGNCTKHCHTSQTFLVYLLVILSDTVKDACHLSKDIDDNTNTIHES